MKLPKTLDKCYAHVYGGCIYMISGACGCPYAYALMNVGDGGETARKHCSRYAEEMA